MISISKAHELIQRSVRCLASESVRLVDSVGRVLAADVCSDVDSPPHDKSVMDGYAMMSGDVSGGRREFKVIETIAAGAWPQLTVTSGCASRIMTGAPIPAGADAVVMVERTESRTIDGIEWVTVDGCDLPAGRHVMLQASNISSGQTVFPKGHELRASDIGLLAESGAASVEVFGRPTVAVLTTGDELVECSEKPGRGQIRNSNGPMLVAMSRNLGLPVTELGIAKDQTEHLSQRVAKGLECDLLLMSGGVSMGQFDLVPEILAAAGVTEIFHKVAIKPGKPIWFGILEGKRPTYVFGLPGNPVSSMVGFHMFVRPAIHELTGGKNVNSSFVLAELNSNHESRGDRPTFWPCRWVHDDSTQRKIEPLIWKGSSDLMALGQAEGLAYFEAGTRVHPAGEVVRVYPL